MKLTLTLLALAFSTPVLASPVTTDYISSPDGLTIVVGKRTYTLPSSPTKSEQLGDLSSSQSLFNKTFDYTSNVQHRIRGQWNYTNVGGNQSTAYLLGMSIPANVLIEKAYVDVITAPGTSTGSPSIAIGCQSAGDILAATTYSNLTAGLSVGREGAGSTDAIKLASVLRTSAISPCSLVVNNSANLSTGKINVYLDYIDESAP